MLTQAVSKTISWPIVLLEMLVLVWEDGYGSSQNSSVLTAGDTDSGPTAGFSVYQDWDPRW